MKMLFSTLVLTLSLLTTSYADDNLINLNNKISISSVVQDINYNEYKSNGVLFDSEKGSNLGFSVQFSMMKNVLMDNDYIYASFERVSGDTRYVGSYQGGKYGDLVASSNHRTEDYAVRYGKAFVLDSGSLLTFYLEAGKHKWNRYAAASVAGSVNEVYTHSYVGIGQRYQFAATEHLAVAGGLFVGKTFNSHISVDLPSFMNSPTLDIDLGDSPIIGASADVDYAITKIVHLTAGVDVCRFQYGESVVVSGMREPDSTTVIITYKTGVSILF